MNISRYTATDQALWDAFVKDSKNGTFLFERPYMDYHSDRFIDHSLLFYDNKERLIALLPANQGIGTNGCDALYSHQGLTYGGLILSAHTSAEEVLQIFEQLLAYLRQCGIAELYYKSMPTIYQRCPSQEDLYALWRNNAQMVSCNLSCSVPLQSQLIPEVERRRRRGYTKAESLGYSLKSDADIEKFWPIMINNLRDRYGASPVHTLDEMRHLQKEFPKQIRCYQALSREGNIEAGAIVYETAQTVHVQYGHATPKGKSEGALDMLYLSLIGYYAEQRRFHYFDFGTSNEQGGQILNENLIAQKEGFGGRGVIYPTFKIVL